MRSIGEQIRTRRQACGLSQAALAAKAGVSGIFIQKIEAGARTPSWGALERLARALGCRVELTLVRRRGT